MNALTIRDMVIDDSTAVIELNLDSVSVTSPMNADRFEELLGLCAFGLVAEVDGVAVGFLMAMVRGGTAKLADYDNGNYRWFSERLQDFTYIDRVVVSAQRRGGGVGRLLYAHTFDRAQRAAAATVCAEIDLEPPNHASLRFHEKAGFVEIGTRLLDSGKRVSMQKRDVPR